MKSELVLGNARLVLHKVGLDLGKYRHAVGLLVCVYQDLACKSYERLNFLLGGNLVLV